MDNGNYQQGDSDVDDYEPNKPSTKQNNHNEEDEDDDYAAHEEYLTQQSQANQQAQKQQQQKQNEDQQLQHRGSHRSSASSQGSRTRNNQPFDQQPVDQQQQQQQNQQLQQQQQQRHDQEQEEEEEVDESSDPISEDIEEKLRVFDEFLKGKNPEQVLNIRMHQLALSKILVFTHRRSQFKLVQAHTNLGVAYLDYKCFEQAIDHLTMALKKNGNLFNEVPESQQYHAEILTQLGKCYLEVGSHEDALELLTKANELQKSVGDANGDLSSVETLKSIAQCYTKMKEFDKAEEVLGDIYDIQGKHYTLNSEEVAFTVVESAKIFSLRGDYNQAVEYQNQAINTLINIGYNKQEAVAELYETLSGYYQKLDMVGEQIDTLQKVKQYYRDIYGETDKKVIKVKRQIAMTYLHTKQYDEALEELLEVEELENKVYGESSVQIAKTLRIIGTIKVLTSSVSSGQEAQKYFSKSLKIFEENGMKNQVKDTKIKLQMAKDIKNKKNHEQYE